VTSTSSGAAQSDKEGNVDYVVTEWQATQTNLLKFDDYLHDIRKYGFSFVTGLLTVDVLFVGPPNFRLAALIGTMGLIVVLFVLDRNYRVFNAASNFRATLLERRCPFELSQTIGRLYEGQRVGAAFTFVYGGLVAVTLIIGCLVVDWSLIWGLAVATGISIITMALLHITLGIRPWVYVDVDGFAYKKREPILVVVSHLRGTRNGLRSKLLDVRAPPLTLRVGEKVWDVYKEEDNLMKDPMVVDNEWKRDPSKDPRIPKEDLLIDERYEHRWECPTGNLENGLYRVVYYGPRYEKGRILHYSLIPELDRLHDTEELLEKHAEELKKRWDDAPRFRILDPGLLCDEF
jgi:hypothetical protein